jgi:hypothetical protein
MRDGSRMIDHPRRAQSAALRPHLAHVRRNDDGSFALHDLEEHLRAVDGQNSDSLGKR